MRVLIAAHVERSRQYYPETSCHSYDSDALSDHGVEMHVGRRDGQAVTIGGLRALDAATVEMKSVFTTKPERGKGYGRLMVSHLIEYATAEGYVECVLETGSDAASASARALYEQLGFRLCPPFGAYTEDPLSVFMRKPL